MFLSAKLRAWSLRDEIQKRQSLYRAQLNCTERLTWQLARFNECWREIRVHVPYYRRLAAEGSLKQEFTDWAQLARALPPIDKGAVRAHGRALQSTARQPDFHRITGGSTAVPVRIPSWRSEWRFTGPDRWLPRSWYGIRIEDKQFTIWGHSHTFGRGIGGFITRQERRLKDYLLGYLRVSAYNMSSSALREAGRKLLDFGPAYVYGYSVALDQFARINRDLQPAFRRLGLHAVIGAAEGFPAADSVAAVEETLGAKVAMEYGSVESELIAHTQPSGGYDVMWQSYFLEAIPTGEERQGQHVCKLLITALYPRCFPLIRYDLGDEICLSRGSPLLGVAHFNCVRGRCNDYLLLRDNTRIHSELITHCVRSVPEISGYQAVQDPNGIRIDVISAAALPEETLSSIQYKLGLVHHELRTTPIRRVTALQRTMAGKSRTVLRICNDSAGSP